MYQVQGTNPYFGNWTYTREIGSQMMNEQTQKLAYYSTQDIYVEHPSEWWGFFGPDHGVSWTAEMRASEIADGDTLYSPFMAAGWSGKAENNWRPAQWLGYLKIQSAWGAEVGA